MPAILLKLLPYILALSLFGLYTVHERSVQKAKDAAADAKAVQLQAQLDIAVQTAAANATISTQETFNNAIHTPVAHAPVPDRLCNFSLGARAVPAAAGSNPSGDAGADIRSADRGPTAELQQFADALRQIGHNADAQVKAVQSDDQTLRTEMEKSNDIVIHPK